MPNQPLNMAVPDNQGKSVGAFVVVDGVKMSQADYEAIYKAEKTAELKPAKKTIKTETETEGA